LSLSSCPLNLSMIREPLLELHSTPRVSICTTSDPDIPVRKLLRDGMDQTQPKIPRHLHVNLVGVGLKSTSNAGFNIPPRLQVVQRIPVRPSRHPISSQSLRSQSVILRLAFLRLILHWTASMSRLLECKRTTLARSHREVAL